MFDPAAQRRLCGELPQSPEGRGGQLDAGGRPLQRRPGQPRRRADLCLRRHPQHGRERLRPMDRQRPGALPAGRAAIGRQYSVRTARRAFSQIRCVMAGLVPAIHATRKGKTVEGDLAEAAARSRPHCYSRTAWMAGTSPAMTARAAPRTGPGRVPDTILTLFFSRETGLFKDLCPVIRILEFFVAIRPSSQKEPPRRPVWRTTPARSRPWRSLFSTRRPPSPSPRPPP